MVSFLVGGVLTGVYEKVFWGAGNVLCFDLGSGYKGVNILKSFELCSEDLCPLYYLSYNYKVFFKILHYSSIHA